MGIDAPHSSQFPSNRPASAAIHRVFLALGANIGDRRRNLVTALQRLHKEVELENISSIYETEPVSYTEQPRFFNLVCQGRTRLEAEELLRYVKEIETILGRKPSFRNGPRPIDIDILFYDNLHIEREYLIIPHPRLSERAFVLVPLAEIAPEIVDPGSGKSTRELLANVSQEGIYRCASDLRISLEQDIQN